MTTRGDDDGKTGIFASGSARAKSATARGVPPGHREEARRSDPACPESSRGRGDAEGEGPKASRGIEAIDDERRRAVELATPTEVMAAPSSQAAPLQIISMKTPAEVAAERKHRVAVAHQVKLRALSEVAAVRAVDLGRLAPPRDPRQARARRVRDALIWGSVVVIIGCAVMLAVWFVARA
jgi:hypothetical protein